MDFRPSNRPCIKLAENLRYTYDNGIVDGPIIASRSAIGQAIISGGVVSAKGLLSEKSPVSVYLDGELGTRGDTPGSATITIMLQLSQMSKYAALAHAQTGSYLM